MSTLVDTPQRAFHRDARIYVSMASGLDFSFPIQGNPRLEGKPDRLLSEIEVSPFGLHWLTLDEDLSFKGILAGDYGQRNARNLHDSPAKLVETPPDYGRKFPEDEDRLDQY
jgi:hypothetical protein